MQVADLAKEVVMLWKFFLNAKKPALWFELRAQNVPKNKNESKKNVNKLAGLVAKVTTLPSAFMNV